MSKYRKSDDGYQGQAAPVQVVAVGDGLAPDGSTRLMFELGCGCDRPECGRVTLTPMVLTRERAAEAITMLAAAAAEIWPGFVADLDQEVTAINHAPEA
jgi:hypothetical protein